MARGKPLQLGRKVAIPASPDDAVLDTVPNPHADTDYAVRFTAPEFTTLCPITGQQLVESKSLKLFLASFRNHAAFHEDCTVAIGKRVVAAIRPKYFRIGGFWYPRGGIPIDVFWQTGRLPKDVWLPEVEVEPYR